MGTIAALLIATPIFGFSLSVDPGLGPAGIVKGAEIYAAVEHMAFLATEDPIATPMTTADLIKKRDKLARVP